MMKKCAVALLALGSLLTAVYAGGIERITFYVKVQAGNPGKVADIYSKNLAGRHHYDTTHKVFTAWVDSSAQQAEFLKKLRVLGQLSNPTNKPDEFAIVVLDDGNTTMLFTIDSSQFKNSPTQLLVIQEVFGKGVCGGQKDQIQRTKAALLIDQAKLERAGFECVINNNFIVIRERRFPHTFTCPASLHELVKAELELHTRDIKIVGNTYEVMLTNSQLAAMQKHLLSSGRVSRISKNKNGITSIEPIPLNTYTVRIMLNNKFEYDKMLPAVKKLKLKIIDHELRESGFGVSQAIFSIRTKIAYPSTIKADIWRAVRAACPRVKSSDIYVEQNKN